VDGHLHLSFPSYLVQFNCRIAFPWVFDGTQANVGCNAYTVGYIVEWCYVASTIRSCGFATSDVSTQSLASVSLLAYIALCRPRLLQRMTSGYCILTALKSVLAMDK
jgi:hypothetical protein